MADVKRKTILISEPGPWETAAYNQLPYVWGILKSYCERHAASIADQFEWLDPIFQNRSVEFLLSSYLTGTIDILGLSCYTWNWDLQCKIARAVKILNPNCLVVAGGPDPDYKDKEFFRNHPYIDIIVVKDGEITFNKILEKITRGQNDFTDIGGLYLPGDDGPVNTGPAEIPLVFDESPYILQQDIYEDIIRKHGGYINATWETNRGCPFKCSFCDWGSNTMSKVRRFDLERVKSEIEWFGKVGVHILYLADANFGMLPRDLEIADLVTTTYSNCGHPKYLGYNNAKNNPERSLAVAQKLFESGMQLHYELAIQHTQEEVLAVNERANISSEKLVQVAKGLAGDGIPVDVQLILGLPGDTLELWKSCLGDVMEWGMHSYYLVYLYHLLPNAPAAEPDYMDEWQIKTIKRYVFTWSSSKRLSGPLDPQTLKNRIIVSTRSFSENDWIEMNTYTAFTKAFHNCGLTHLIAKYLRFTHNVPYREFYSDLIRACTRMQPMQSCLQTVTDHYQAYLADDAAIDFMNVSAWPQYQYEVNPFQWLYVQCCMQLDPFYDFVKAFLIEKYPSAANLSSVIDYQKDLVILPSYRKEQGKSFTTDFNWIDYFKAAEMHSNYEPLDEPDQATGAHVMISDQTCTDSNNVYPLDWGSGNDDEQWAVWFDQTVDHRSCPTRSNFQELRLQRRVELQIT